MKNKEDMFFEIIARKYMEDDGENLRKISEELNKQNKDSSRLDLKVKRSINRMRFKKYYIASSLVGCALIIILMMNSILLKNMNLTGSGSSNSDTTQVYYDKEYAMQKLASILPAGYRVSDSDYDNGKTIFYVLNDKNDQIVLEEDPSKNGLETYGLRKFNLQNTEAYGISKADYSLITFKLGDKLYTITSAYDARGLIAIGESIISTNN